MRLQEKCARCSKPLELRSSTKWSSTQLLKEYKCGHAFIDLIDTSKFQPLSRFTSLDERHTAYDFQVEGIEFAAETEWNCAITDPMGLGKTIQALLAWLHFCETHENSGTCLIVVKSATIWQWIKQYQHWVTEDPLGVFMITGSNGFIPPGFHSYLISMDTLSRLVKTVDNEDVYEMRSSAYFGASAKSKCKIDPQLRALGIKFIIVDECQSFKNPESKRSAALVNLITELGIKHKIMLSGTPIKNRADEYFVLLNLLAPTEFPSLKRFRSNWLVKNNYNNKYDRISPYRMEAFREMTSRFVIRREKNEVLKNLPPFRRTFETIFIDNEELKKLYNAELEKLKELDEKCVKLSWMEIQDSMMTLRRITALAKVDFAVNYIDTFLETCDEKIAIGIHHKAVRDLLYYKLEQRGFKPLKLSGEDSAENKFRIVQQFQAPDRRVLIINMLAGGVGVDGLQHACNNVLILERQWNAADEEQFESRFNRDGQKLPVLAEYMIAKGTIDEDFTIMVEEKRQISGETLDGWDFTSSPESIRELVQRTILHRL